VRLGAFFLRTEGELALTGRRCIPDRLVEMGFKFIYTNLESALADLLQPLNDEPRGESREASSPSGMPRLGPSRYDPFRDSLTRS
jgi:hypothetical protein